MTVNVPADLSGLSDEELDALAAQIREAAQDIGDTATNSDESLAALEALASDHQRITEEQASRVEQSAARQQRVAAALEAMGGPEDPDGDENGEDDPIDPAADTERQPVAAATTEPTTTAIEETPVPQTPAPAAVVAALNATRPATPVPTAPRREAAALVNTGAVRGNEKGQRLDTRALARLVQDQVHRYSRTSGTSGPIVLAHSHVDWEPDETVTRDSFEKNFQVMDAAAKRGEALVASGANCALLAPNYDVPSWAEAMSPVESALPTVGAPRGGIRFVTPPSWEQANDGVRFTTAAQDAAGYTTSSDPGPTAVKPCVRLECPAPLECVVDAVSACVELGNLQTNTFPELIEVFLDHLGVRQQQIKEIYLLDGIDAGSTEVNFAGTYGATRSFVHAFALAAHAMRKRLHMSLDAPIDVFISDGIIPLIRTDMVNDLHMGLGFLGADPQTVARELFTALKLNVTWYYDYSADVGTEGSMQIAQTAGTLNPFPYTFRSWMFPPGTWVKLDGGTLDVGMIRDSALVETNDYRIFAEEWLQVCKRGVESIALDITACPSGTGPSTVSALSCSS